jgi:phosphoribosyl 1,2-cyclic phosphodiesterase
VQQPDRASGKMDLVFLGTRGEIERRTRRHGQHSALLLRHGRARIMIDCGADWREHLAQVGPSAILLTHGHPDHAFGLADGAPCPVYATGETWRLIERYPIPWRRTVAVGERFSISGLRFEAFAVTHSVRAPAVGYRITAGAVAMFYVPDVVAIHHRKRALAGVSLYIGDGASLVRPILRQSHGRRIGHTTIRAQLRWCACAGVRNAIFTHCGSGIVGGHARRVGRTLQRLARERGVAAAIAHDGLTVTLPVPRRRNPGAMP